MIPQIGHSIRCQPPAALLVGSYLVLVLTIGIAHSMPYNTDCMKNPFATGCRGISAKRSGSSPLWYNNADTDQLVKWLGPQATPSRANLYELVSSDHRANQLIVAIDLVADAVQRLAKWQAQELLLQSSQDNSHAVKRTLGKKGQPEEASS